MTHSSSFMRDPLGPRHGWTSACSRRLETRIATLTLGETEQGKMVSTCEGISICICSETARPPKSLVALLVVLGGHSA